MYELVLALHLNEVVALFSHPSHGREYRDKRVLDPLILLCPQRSDQMRKANSGAGSADSSAAVNDSALLGIRCMQHVSEDLPHLEEGLQ